MRRISRFVSVGATAATMAAAMVATAQADAPPPPPNPEQLMVARAMEAAGTPCKDMPDTQMLLGADAAKYDKQGYYAFRAVCGDRTYVVQIPQQFLVPDKDANGRPLPPPPPIVTLLPK